MARIMVIAGGAWQCPIVKTAKEMGHEVICTNLYANSPAFQFADYAEQADVLDKEKNLEIAKKYQPDAVLTDQSDIAVPTVAYIAEKMKLRGIGQDIASLFTNKYKMREFCEHHGFPYPKYKLCYTVEDALVFFENELKSKAIIKPLDSQSSRGIHVITSKDDLHRYFNDALQYSNSSKSVVLEQYIDGTEFTVDGLKTHNGYYVTAISRKKHFSYNPSIAKELFFSESDPEFDYQALRQLDSAIVMAMGLPFGLTHAEFKFMDGQYYLIEIAARGGGTRISSDLTKIMSGINTNEQLIHELLGEETIISLNPDSSRCAMLGFFDFKPGKVLAIQGLEKARAMTGVVDIGLDFKEGDTIANALDDRSRCGYYILYANGREQLRSLEASIYACINLVYEGATQND